MKYSLVVYLKNKSHIISGYSKIPGFEHLDETKLKDIVSFTNEFETEQELICYLIETNLLPKEFFTGTIGINYYKSKTAEPKTLQYGVSFKEDKKFFDTIFLQYYFKRNLNNKNFMSAFIHKYYTYLKDVYAFSEELKYLNYSYNCLVKENYVPEEAEEFMAKFITVYCRKKSKDGYYKADFTKIRDLAMFAINYERNFIRVPVERPIRPVEDIELAISHYNELLENSITDEEIEAYTNKLNKLEDELEFTEKATMIRRRKNDTTRN